MTEQTDVNDPTLTFDSDCGIAKSMRGEIKYKQEALRLIDQRIMGVLFGRGVTGHKTDDGSWSIQNKITRSIDRAKLIALGVSLETIEAATNESSSDPFLVWREKKAKDDGTLPS